MKLLKKYRTTIITAIGIIAALIAFLIEFIKLL
jgi:hypothetical protein